MKDPITIWELSKNKTGLPVDLCVIDINTDYNEEEIKKENFPSRLIMQNYYESDKGKNELVHISIDKDNPKLLKDKLNISEEDFSKVQEFIKKHYEDFMNYINDNIDIKELRNKVYSK